MRVLDLFEAISSRVFHYTRVTTALKILQSMEFELSHTLGTSWEAQFAPKGYPYFLSTTRTRHGGYHGWLGQDAVLFELDGDFYNRRYPGKAVDYWNNRDPAKDHHKAHEAEDRIFSREAAIPAAITAIDLYIAPDADDAARARTRQVIILAKKAGIPVNLFNDQEAWRRRDTRKTADVGQLKGQDPARGYVSRRKGGYLKPWMELMQAKTKAQLSKDADRKRYDLQYTYDKQGLAKSLAVDLSNARKPGPDPDRNNAIRIIKFMQQNQLATVNDFVNYLADKWKNIKEDVTSSLTEIGYSDRLGNLNIADSEIIASARQVGTISQKPVMKYDQGNTTLFFFNDQDKITALVLIADQNKLRAIKNFSGQPGQVYALMNYVVNIDNRRLVITSDEPLTKEGFKWLAQLIKNPSGLKVSDLNGDPIDINALHKEWLKSQSTQGTESGKTGIVIGESSIQWKTKLQANESRLMPHIYFNVDQNLKEDSRPVYHLPELVLVLDPHFFERIGTRELNRQVVEQLLDRLKNLTRELQKFEPGQKIWVYSPSLRAKLGMRRQMDRNGKMTYLLKTIVKDPTWDNPDPTITVENFADGKKPGRKGLAKRVGVNCKQPVSKLRKIAKNSSGERQRMAHWCANMKSGRNR